MLRSAVASLRFDECVLRFGIQQRDAGRAVSRKLSAAAHHVRSFVWKVFHEKYSLPLNVLNVANRRVLLDNSLIFGGFHYNDPLRSMLSSAIVSITDTRRGGASARRPENRSDAPFTTKCSAGPSREFKRDSVKRFWLSNPEREEYRYEECHAIALDGCPRLRIDPCASGECSRNQIRGQPCRQERQTPEKETSAQGQATFELSPDGKSLKYTLSVNDAADVTMAHIHLGEPGQAGKPVAPLYPEKMSSMSSKSSDKTAGASDDKMAMGTGMTCIAQGTITASKTRGFVPGKIDPGSRGSDSRRKNVRQRAHESASGRRNSRPD